MRALTSLTTLALVLTLTACGDDGNTTMVTTNTPTSNPTATATDSGTTTTATASASGTTTDTPTTNPTTSVGSTTDDPSAGTTTDDPSAGTTTDPSGGTSTTTDPSGGTTDDPSAGSSGDSSGGSSTGGGSSDVYGPCDDKMMCAGDQECAGVGMIDGTFCVPACSKMVDCPDAPDGVVAQPMCLLTQPMEMDPSGCVLICDPAAKVDECPTGMTCKDVPMQMGVGLCTAP